ncbi:MAG: pantoate--beta-alanine ligase [Acidimicrobiaceae bacterium]|nr:pantoate--beta-alanine ligase [Acidimicrobiaceae bacterium]HAB57127.1 pantoate--beta-alanine ligase [Acidimicrobiaceae bacterium]
MLDAHRAAGRSIGFVPTMGYLHAGHRSLMRASAAANDITIVSIFVNPLQFAAGEDLGSYPRDIARDTDCCTDAGVDLIFAPSAEEMYPGPMATVVDVPPVAAPLEGASRPEHFAGVATVVAKLFSIMGECRAYFGEKDWQQVAVVTRMAADLSMPVEVVPCPTMREPDGLAMSSRNIYLSSDERAEAPVLRRALDAGLAVVSKGETDRAAVEGVMADTVATASLATLDYVAAVQAETLVADGPLHGEVRLLVAVCFGEARLIDNDGGMVPGKPA